MLRHLASDAARGRRALPSEVRTLLLRRTAADVGLPSLSPAAPPLPLPLPLQRRSMSDNLLGHSPMARPVPRAPSSPPPKSPGEAGPSWAPDANTAGGGVWAQTSAKRDKLAELKLELDWDRGQRTLDDAATEEQRWDLRLADGLRLVARATDGAWDVDDPCRGGGGGGGEGGAEEENDGRGGEGADANADEDVEEGGTASPEKGAPTARRRLGPSSKSHPLLVGLDRWLTSTESKRGGEGGAGGVLARDRFEAHLSEAIRLLSPNMGGNGGAVPPPPGPMDDTLRHLRDFVEFDPDPADDGGVANDAVAAADDGRYAPPPDVDADLRRAEAPFDGCVARLRILLTRNAAERLKSSWDDIVSSSDADVDRAAVRGEAAGPRSSLPLSAVNDVLRAHMFGTCRDRLRAWWGLAAAADGDGDGDGEGTLLEQAEMDAAVHRSLGPVEDALREMFAEALEAAPPGDAPTTWEEEEVAARFNRGATAVPPAEDPKKGWRQRRREKKDKRRLAKMFDGTLANHFEVEVETPHRLRCIYAWANKAHQGGKVDSVLVDSGGAAGGRKRYVELQPKISLGEFEEVQGEHFPHLYRAGEEVLLSFREDLLVRQGKGRQNRELRKDCFLFIAGVSLIDAGILML